MCCFYNNLDTALLAYIKYNMFYKSADIPIMNFIILKQNNTLMHLILCEEFQNNQLYRQIIVLECFG